MDNYAIDLAEKQVCAHDRFKLYWELLASEGLIYVLGEAYLFIFWKKCQPIKCERLIQFFLLKNVISDRKCTKVRAVDYGIDVLLAIDEGVYTTVRKEKRIMIRYLYTMGNMTWTEM